MLGRHGFLRVLCAAFLCGGAAGVDITFVGGAGQVGGSCALVESEGGKVLVDCGTFYGEDFKWLIRHANCAYRGGAVVTCLGNLLLAAAGYQILPVRWDELLDSDYENCCLTWKEGGVKAAVKAHTYSFPPKPKFESAFVGAEGEKVTVDVCLTRVSGFDSRFGHTNVYTFEDKNHNLLVWKTGTCLDIEVGAYVTLTGTIKEHFEYRDTKQTVLTRCKLAAA
jgi:hypothetical protein